MKVRIIKGTNQIGGCITEIICNKTKIIIDYGEDLEDNNNPFELDGLTKGKSIYDAVFITHSHGDHIGLIDLINDIITSYDLDNASEASVLEENKAMSLEEIQEELKIVKENIEDYEVDVALEILNNVKKHKLSVDMINLLESIEGKIDDFEYGDAIEIIDKNMDKTINSYLF